MIEVTFVFVSNLEQFSQQNICVKTLCDVYCHIRHGISLKSTKYLWTQLNETTHGITVGTKQFDTFQYLFAVKQTDD